MLIIYVTSYTTTIAISVKSLEFIARYTYCIVGIFFIQPSFRYAQYIIGIIGKELLQVCYLVF